MNSPSTSDKDDWEQLRELEEQLVQGSELDVTEWGSFLARVCPELGMASDECARAIMTPAGAAALVHEARRRIREGDQRLGAVIKRVSKLSAQGRRKEAREAYQELLQREEIALFREIAERELNDLIAMRVIAEREYVFTRSDADRPEKVILRIGAPEQEGPANWVLPFEIIGPGSLRSEHTAPGHDAVQALESGLGVIATELNALQETAGGTLTYLKKKKSGLSE